MTGSLLRRHRGRSAAPFWSVSQSQRRQADLFWAALTGESTFPAESESAEDDDLRSWPTLTTLPGSIVDRITANRGRVTRRDKELVPVPNGYSARGKAIPPSQVCTPEEERNPRLNALISRLNVELAGEGGTSAILTGDRAGFTWGRGLAHGGSLEAWVSDFFVRAPQAKDALLDLGITLSGTTWKIVDTDTRTVKSGADAIELLNHREPADTKKLLLSVFMNVAEQFGTAAADAQWAVTKREFFYGKVPKDIIDDTSRWDAKAVCYVLHCSMWGTFAGWARFKATEGDPKKILRLEVDYTGYYERKDSFILVPTTFGSKGAIFPSATMLLNMGAGYMVTDKIVRPIGSLTEAQKGDVVFQLPKAASKQEFYRLQGVPTMYDPLEEMMKEILDVQAYPMSSLLKYFEGVRDRGGRNKGFARLKTMRDYYASDKNPRKEIVGLRPRVAMDSVLHRGEGEPSGWILADARRASLPPDQIELIKKKVGLS